jgi:hypothetical protein
VGEEFLVAVHLCARDLVRDKVRVVDGVYLRVGWPELEDEIEQLIDLPTFDNVNGDLVRLQEKQTR